jgi:hypothetical protein
LSASLAVLQYGTSTSFGKTISASGYYFSAAELCLYDGIMLGLKSNTQYYYSVDGSDTFSFTNQPVRSGGNIYAILADFGALQLLQLFVCVDATMLFEDGHSRRPAKLIRRSETVNSSLQATQMTSAFRNSLPSPKPTRSTW